MLKSSVKSYWEDSPCGTGGLQNQDRIAFFKAIEERRYSLEPYIRDFAHFETASSKKLLEVGIGAGTDFTSWVRSGANAFGVDLTEHGIRLTKERLSLEDKTAKISVSDAENLPFQSNCFDLVYSWGVLHHSPNTVRAIEEVHRVLRPGGTALVMIYNTVSWCVLINWIIHCLLKGRPWRSPKWAVYRFQESPGTKVYTRGQTKELFATFKDIQISTQLTHSDLLLSKEKRGFFHTALRAVYPRWLVRFLGNRFGFFMMIKATK